MQKLRISFQSGHNPKSDTDLLMSVDQEDQLPLFRIDQRFSRDLFILGCWMSVDFEIQNVYLIISVCFGRFDSPDSHQVPNPASQIAV